MSHATAQIEVQNLLAALLGAPARALEGANSAGEPHADAAYRMKSPSLRGAIATKQSSFGGLHWIASLRSQ